MISAIIFDMDGTLVNTEDVSQIAWRRALDAAGIKTTPEWRLGFIGKNIASNTETLVELTGSRELAESIYADHNRILDELSPAELKLKPGAREAVAAARRNGYGVALATGTYRDRTEWRLERFGLTDAFDFVICGDEIVHGKPAPDLFLQAAAGLGVDPGLCLVVEDSPNGVLAAHAAGTRIFLIPDRIEPTPEITAMCDAVLDTLLDVEEAAKRL